MSFVEFIDWIKFSSATCVHPVPMHYQLDWFCDTNGKVIANFIGRFENINHDWNKIKQNISQNMPELKSLMLVLVISTIPSFTTIKPEK